MARLRFDVAIVGCGPAGMSAAIWSDDLHLRAVVLESTPTTGGQLIRVFNPVANYPGIETPDGAAMADRFRSSLHARRVNVRVSSAVARIDADRRTVAVNDDEIDVRFILVASGVRPRQLDVPGARALAGRGVHGSATKNAEKYRGARAVVVGGGDAALEEALVLARECESVTIVHRRERFSGRHDFRDRVASNPRIRTIMSAHVLAIEGLNRVEGVSIESPTGTVVVQADAVFPCLGVEPNSDLVRALVTLDDRGYIRTDERQRTSVDWIYAAGDVCSNSSLTIAAAVGQAAAAIKDMSRRVSANA